MYRFSRSGTCPRSFRVPGLYVSPVFTCPPLHPSSSGACPPPCPHLPYQKCGAESFRHNSAGRCQESAPCRTIKRIRKGTRTGGTCPHLEAGAWTGVNNPRSGPRRGHVPLLSKRYVSPVFTCPRSFRVPGLFVSSVFTCPRSLYRSDFPQEVFVSERLCRVRMPSEKFGFRFDKTLGQIIGPFPPVQTQGVLA